MTMAKRISKSFQTKNAKERHAILASFGERLESLRSSKGLSLSEVSNATGIDLETLSGYEAGKSEPKLTAILRISEVLSISPEQLIDFDIR
jgi:transcriptional regulator with XRE-family HTH domain